MPSEKAKENKTLVAQCAVCGKTTSTELILGAVVERAGRWATIPVCDDCRAAGRIPPTTAA